MRISTRQRTVASVSIGIALIGAFAYQRIVLASPGHEGDEPAAQETVSTQISIETASDGGTSVLGSDSISWSGEIFSNADVQIHPSREGQIAEWNVKLGQAVRKGQVLGRLSPPPASIELSSALAERTRALVMARAQAQATAKLVQDSKNRLAILQASLSRSRDTALALADKELLRDIQSRTGAARELGSVLAVQEAAVAAAQTELAEAEALFALEFQTTRNAYDRLAFGFSGKISPYGSAPTSSEQATGAGFRQFSLDLGFLDNSARSTYIQALTNYLEALEDPKALPEAQALAYVEATRNLVNTSLSLDGHLAEIDGYRKVLNHGELILLDALSDYRSAEATVTVRKSELARITAEAQRDSISADTAAINADTTVTIADSVKANKIAETEAEFAQQKAELDATISELDRELYMANAEVRAAQSAYGVIANGAGGQNIVATRSGAISAIYKNLGDHVVPEVAVLGISSKEAAGRFVRFKVPSDMRLPREGEEVSVKRPGFPLDEVRARVVGVGISLDSNGFYAADAEFLEPVEWPVHLSVRVVGSQAGNPVLVPLSAVWWDAGGIANVWLVMENNVIRPQEVTVGRAVGDRVEIEEGLNSGERFVSKANESLKTGLSVTEATGTPTGKAAEPLPKGDDGHEH